MGYALAHLVVVHRVTGGKGTPPPPQEGIKVAGLFAADIARLVARVVWQKMRMGVRP